MYVYIYIYIYIYIFIYLFTYRYIGGVPLGAVTALSWCGEVSVGGYTYILIIIITVRVPPWVRGG